jgi:hypothetical protein
MYYAFNRPYGGSNIFELFVNRTISEFNNSKHIIDEFYNAMTSEDCKSDPIHFPDFYKPVIHLTSSSSPEPMDMIIHDLYLNLTCEYDNILRTKVKYWTAYLDKPVIPASKQSLLNSTVLIDKPI